MAYVPSNTPPLARINPTWRPAVGDLGLLAPFFGPRGDAAATAAGRPPLPPLDSLSTAAHSALDDMLHGLDLISARPTRADVDFALAQAMEPAHA